MDGAHCPLRTKHRILRMILHPSLHFAISARAFEISLWSCNGESGECGVLVAAEYSQLDTSMSPDRSFGLSVDGICDSFFCCGPIKQFHSLAH